MDCHAPYADFSESPLEGHGGASHSIRFVCASTVSYIAMSQIYGSMVLDSLASAPLEGSDLLAFGRFAQSAP